MGYPRTQVKTALNRAKSDGKDCLGMAPDLRDTELTLERWGYLPLADATDIDAKVADWYVQQGLAVRVDDVTVADPVLAVAGPSEAAMAAAEAALEAARAALAFARSITPPSRVILP